MYNIYIEVLYQRFYEVLWKIFDYNTSILRDIQQYTATRGVDQLR